MATEIKLAIVGSREFSQPKRLFKLLDQFIKDNDYVVTEIISGGAAGVDTYAAQYAQYNKIPLKVHKAEWEKYGKKAGPIRNEYIIRDCDVCFAVWNGTSRGTKNDIDWCHKLNKDCWVYDYTTDDLYQEV